MKQEAGQRKPLIQIAEKSEISETRKKSRIIRCCSLKKSGIGLSVRGGDSACFGSRRRVYWSSLPGRSGFVGNLGSARDGVLFGIAEKFRKFSYCKNIGSGDVSILREMLCVFISRKKISLANQKPRAAGQMMQAVACPSFLQYCCNTLPLLHTDTSIHTHIHIMSQRRAAAAAAAAVSTAAEITKEEIIPHHHKNLETKSIPLTSLQLDDGADDDDNNNNVVDHHSETLPLTKSSSSSSSNHQIMQAERQKARLKHWRESPFAIGLTEPTWMEERNRPTVLSRAYNSSDNNGGGGGEVEPDETGCLCFSAQFCPVLRAGRLGNMAVLKSSHEWVEEVSQDAETGEETVHRYTRPKLDIVVGPYWPMMVLITYPLILGVSGWTYWSGIRQGGKPVGLVFLWFVCTVGLILSLACTAFRDPGILYKQKVPPPQNENAWRWTDQAQSYRPRGAYYDRDTAVIVEGFDHT